MGLLDNIQNFGQRVRTASQPFLDVYNTPEFQQQITLGTSLLSGAGVPASIQAANQAGLLAQNTQNIRRQREGIEALKKRFANNPNILSLLNKYAEISPFVILKPFILFTTLTKEISVIFLS